MTPEPGRRGELLGYREGRDAAVRMRQRRRMTGLSREELAALLGKRVSWVEMREHGSIRMSAAEAEMVEEVLGMNPGDLTREMPGSGRRQGGGRVA